MKKILRDKYYFDEQRSRKKLLMACFINIGQF